MKDGYTKILTKKINDWGLEKIYEMEDDLASLEYKVPEIIAYLKDIHFSMPLGLALRRYMCEYLEAEYDSEKRCYVFNLPEKQIVTKDYSDENYDIENDDLAQYIEIFQYINAKYNTGDDGKPTLDITKAEIRRQLRITTVCTRSKMFLLSFALHMDNVYTAKFLTDVLAEQTYNYREPSEIIALFCQSHPEYNNYGEYEKLCRLYESNEQNAQAEKDEKENYTVFAGTKISQEINTVDELMKFLTANVANFHKYSETAYQEYLKMYKKAGDKLLGHDDSGEITASDVENWIKNRKNSVTDETLIYPEQLAKSMLDCIPRATFKTYKKSDTEKKNPIVSADFIKIYNGENGQDEKKVKTTELPKSITMNLPVSDRLWDLIRKEKAVTRKDLVLMKFYVFSLYLEEKENYSMTDYYVFLSECNAMLIRCGMSKLYPGNRFENLVMLSLLASHPFDMFEYIIEYSFMNEPKYD